MGMVPKSWCNRLCALLLAAFPVPAMRTHLHVTNCLFVPQSELLGILQVSPWVC